MSITTRGWGLSRNQRINAMHLPIHRASTMPSADQTRELVPVASDEKRSLQDARWTVAGRPKGK